jgi:hypothetical protein
LTNNQLSQWQELKTKFNADYKWKLHDEKVFAKRGIIRPQAAQALEAFVAHPTSSEDFRSLWDTKTRSEWSTFGLGGLSSAMFLNMLVKHIGDQDRLLKELCNVIRVPADEPTGRNRMAAFDAFLEGEIDSGRVTRRQIQTARIPFFVSAFWHLQNTEAWPISYQSARKVFQRHGLYSPAANVVEDYFGFRDVYLSLMEALKLRSWDLEQLCWFDIDPVNPLGTSPHVDVSVAADIESDDAEVAPASTEHTHAQWLLASIGKVLKCKIWIAGNDHNKQWNGQRLGDMSIPSLPPLGIGDKTAEKIVRLIDVLWLKSSNQVVAAFEIEHSTSIYSGLLRMADLAALLPNILFPLYIVVPEQRLDDVRRQLSRPSLQALDLHLRCGFFSIEALAKNAESIKTWAKEPNAIGKLAAYVEELDAEEV